MKRWFFSPQARSFLPVWQQLMVFGGISFKEARDKQIMVNNNCTASKGDATTVKTPGMWNPGKGILFSHTRSETSFCCSEWACPEGREKKKGALETKRSSKRRSWAATKTIHVVWVLEMELPPLHNKGRLRRIFPLLTSASWQCPSDHVKQLCWAETI